MRQPSFDRGPRGPQGHNAGFQRATKQQKQVMLRLFGFVMKYYKFSILTVLACIVVSSITSLMSTLFTRTLIDDYITPLTQVANPEYASLLQTLFKLGLILLLGVIASYTYNRLMINVSQGTMLRLRKQIFERMERLPVSYFDSHSHGELMSVYTNDVDSLRQMISTAMAQVFSSVIHIDGGAVSTADFGQHLHRRGDDDCHYQVGKMVERILPHAAGEFGKSQRFHRGNDDWPEGSEGVLS